MVEEGKRKKGPRKRTMEIDEMIKLYLEGKGTSEIAEAANVSPRYVRLILKENNVPMRPFGDWKRKYKLNEHYFKTWSNNMAYILGFFIADGFIASSQQTVSFAQKDKALLEQIRNEIGSDQVLYQNPQTGVYSLNLNSKIMKHDLIEIFGITSNKSIEVKFPSIPEEYLSHFTRGYFDGDGYVNLEKRVVNFVGGSQQFMESFCKLLNSKGFSAYLKRFDEKYYRVLLTGNRSVYLFGEWIYKSKELYLKRKFDIFQKESKGSDHLVDRKLKHTKNAVLLRKQDFIKLYYQNRSIEQTCDTLEIKIQTFNRWLKQDSDFQRQFQQINDV